MTSLLSRIRIVMVAVVGWAALTIGLSGCGTAPGSAIPGLAGSGNSSTASVRFVLLFPPSIPGPFDIHAGIGTDHLPTVASAVAAGTVTDYLAVPAGGNISITRAGDDKPIVYSAAVGSGNRHTIAFGANASGDPEVVGFNEQAGAVLDQTGQHPLPLDPGKAMVLGSGIGEGAAMSSGGFLLGQPGRGCLTEPDQSGDTRSVVGSGSDVVSFLAAPGPLRLAWYAGLDCGRASSAAVNVRVEAGQTVLAFAWYKTERDLHLLTVPVSATGKGAADATDSGTGPATDPTATGADAGPATGPDATADPTDATADPTDPTGTTTP